MATSYKLSSVLSLSCLVLMATTITTATNRTKLLVSLIHRDSIFPSLVNPNHDDDYTIAPLIPVDKLFFVNISIGEPPISYLLAFDTGSSLTWIQRPSTPVSCPRISSTCTPLSCNSPYRSPSTRYWDRSYCGQGHQCMYQISYLDRSECRGIIALDKFTFATSTGGIAQVHDVVFGYGIESHGNVRRISGILGLQARDNQYSLLSRVGHKFSYCIGNISDPHYMYNQLVLGEGAVLEGDSTPLTIKNGQYVVRLLGISVGEKQLKIEHKQDDDPDVVIDSGSTMMLLKRHVYEPLKEQVTSLLDGVIQPVVVSRLGERPCYLGEMVRDLKGFPTVTLHLDNGADLSLDVEGVFERIDESMFCLAAEYTTPDKPLSIIGILAQQYHNVGFDMDEMKVTFLNIECELLQD